ncbi:MAG: hypothetical protein R3B70_24635 [Polyangiaceae bacterium]
MKRSLFRTFLLGLFPLTLLALAAPACTGAPAVDYCDAYCECPACPANGGRDVCIDQWADVYESADRQGCGGEFVQWLRCAGENIDCSEDPNGFTACQQELFQFGNCTNF